MTFKRILALPRVAWLALQSIVLASSVAKRVAFVAVTLALPLTGCSYFFGPKADPAPVEVRDERLGCLRDITDKNLDQQIDCTIAAMEKFDSNTSGQRADSWSLAELESFIATYLGKGQGERSAWLTEGLKWKSALIGGEDGRITRSELKLLREVVARLKPTLVRLDPFRQLVLFKLETASSDEVERAVGAIGAVAGALEGELSKVNQSGVARKPFPLSTVTSSALAVGLGERSTLDYLSLAEAAKGLLFGGDEKTVVPAEWPEVVRWGGKLWELALRARYRVKGNDRLLAEDLGTVEKAVGEIDEVLNRALRAHGAKGIPRERIERVVTELEKRALLPVNLRAQTVNELLPQLLSKVLYGNAHADKAEKAAAFSKVQEQVLLSAAKDWLAGQRLLNRALGGRDAGSADNLARVVGQSLTQSREELRAKAQLYDLLATGRPLPFDDDGRLIVKKRAELPELRRTDLERLNLTRALAGLLLRGYTHQADAAEKTSGITEAETQELYLDIRSVGLELKLVDPRNDKQGTRSFMEANIFLSVSNGDKLVSLHEAVEWFHVIFSGARIADRMLEVLDRACGIEGTSDVFGRRLLETKRFRTEFDGLVAERFSNLPALSAWWRRSDPDTIKNAQLFMEKAGRSAGDAIAPIDTSELRNFGPILHYVESVFARHDVNANDVLDNDEVWGAFPLVQPVIVQLSNGMAMTEDLQRTIFSWLIYWGEPPSTDAVGIGKVLAWSLARHAVTEKADRLDFLKVMGAIGTATREARVKQIAEFWQKHPQEELRTAILSGDPGTVAEITSLFQCLPGAGPTLGADLKYNIKFLFPPNTPQTAVTFTANVKKVIAVDARLNNLCLPF